MKDVQLRLWFWLSDTVERCERNETNVEHVGNELVFELPHLVEQLPHLVAVVFPGGA